MFILALPCCHAPQNKDICRICLQYFIKMLSWWGNMNASASYSIWSSLYLYACVIAGSSRWTLLCCAGSTVTHCLTDIIWQTAWLWLQQSAINSAPNPHCHHLSWLQPCFICCCSWTTYESGTVKVRAGGVTSSRGCEPDWKPPHCTYIICTLNTSSCQEAISAAVTWDAEH